MTPSEALSKWQNSAAAKQNGERFVLIGNMIPLANALRHFKKDEHADIELISESPAVGYFRAVIKVVPRLPERELQPGQFQAKLQPFFLLVS